MRNYRPLVSHDVEVCYLNRIALNTKHRRIDDIIRKNNSIGATAIPEN